MMNSTDLTKGMYEYGRSEALKLREEGSMLDGTAIIEREAFAPAWRPGAYNVYGAPVEYEGQIYTVLQVHDSTETPDWTPAAVPALFSPCHTKNPAKAKPWLAPNGISGLYMKDECYKAKDGTVKRQIYDGVNEYDAEAAPDRWENVNM